MIDMSSVIIAKSDQINAADLIGTSRTVTIAGVKLTGAEQATEIRLANEDKVWRPNKNTVRIMARAWGNDGEKWIGRSATLYCDPKVKFGKDTPGGIRISHLSGLRDRMTVCLQERKGQLKTYEIEPLQVEQATEAGDDREAKASSWVASYITKVNACTDGISLHALNVKASNTLSKLAVDFPTLHATAIKAADDKDASFGAGYSTTTPSETLSLTIAEMQRQATQDGLDSWLARSNELIDSFDEDDRKMFDAAVAERREAWG